MNSPSSNAATGPMGFWSYSRTDDKLSGGRISDLKSRLQDEISLLTGVEAIIFQDIRELRVGDEFSPELHAAIEGSSFLIPVLTPRYFKRDWCRKEVLKFKEVCDNSRIAPVYFPILFVEYEEELDCEIQNILNPLVYEDFRDWRKLGETERLEIEEKFSTDVRDKVYWKGRNSRW